MKPFCLLHISGSDCLNWSEPSGMVGWASLKESIGWCQLFQASKNE